MSGSVQFNKTLCNIPQLTNRMSGNRLTLQKGFMEKTAYSKRTYQMLLNDEYRFKSGIVKHWRADWHNWPESKPKNQSICYAKEYYYIRYSPTTSRAVKCFYYWYRQIRELLMALERLWRFIRADMTDIKNFTLS